MCFTSTHFSSHTYYIHNENMSHVIHTHTFSAIPSFHQTGFWYYYNLFFSFFCQQYSFLIFCHFELYALQLLMIDFIATNCWPNICMFFSMYYYYCFIKAQILRVSVCFFHAPKCRNISQNHYDYWKSQNQPFYVTFLIYFFFQYQTKSTVFNPLLERPHIIKKIRLS